MKPYTAEFEESAGEKKQEKTNGAPTASAKTDTKNASTSTSATTPAVTNTTAPAPTPAKASLIQLETAPCDPPLDITQEQLDIELDFFSRTFDKKRYNNARIIYDELRKNGKHPRVSVHTWELYDKAFSFPRVRRFDLVQHHMDLIQHFEDNLN